MSVCIRLARHGRTHRAFYRIVAIDKRCHREGVANEILGVFDPYKAEKGIEIKMDRVEAWVKKGAVISEGLATRLKHEGYQVPTAVAAVPAAKAKAPAGAKAKKKHKTPKSDGKTWVAPTRHHRNRHLAKLKAERVAAEAVKAAAAAAAPAPAEAPKA